MAENVTPVVLKVKDFAPREVLLVNYKFNQATDQEGQVAGITTSLTRLLIRKVRLQVSFVAARSSSA